MSCSRTTTLYRTNTTTNTVLISVRKSLVEHTVNISLDRSGKTLRPKLSVSNGGDWNLRENPGNGGGLMYVRMGFMLSCKKEEHGMREKEGEGVDDRNSGGLWDVWQAGSGENDEKQRN